MSSDVESDVYRKQFINYNCPRARYFASIHYRKFASTVKAGRLPKKIPRSKPGYYEVRAMAYQLVLCDRDSLGLRLFNLGQVQFKYTVVEVGLDAFAVDDVRYGNGPDILAVAELHFDKVFTFTQ